jgi:hypothetical protein
MPDLDIAYRQACTNVLRSDKVKSSRGTGEYTVTASLDGKSDFCTCPGWKFHGHCRHIDLVRKQLCSWQEDVSEEQQTPQQEMSCICPRCGGETTVFKVAV